MGPTLEPMPGRLNDRAAQSLVLSAQPASAINFQKRLHQMTWPFVRPDIEPSGRRVRQRGWAAAWGKSGTSARSPTVCPRPFPTLQVPVATGCAHSAVAMEVLLAGIV